MKRLFKIFLATAIIFSFSISNWVRAQYPYYDGLFRYWPSDDSLKLRQVEPHLSVSTGFIGNSRGDNRVFTSVAPSFTYRANEKVTFMGGFSVLSDFGLDRNFVNNPIRSKAPRRDRNGGTGIVSAEVGMHYQVNDKFLLSAWLYHAGGQYAPFYSRINDGAFDVSVTALSASAAYRFNNEDFLRVSLTVIRDHTGSMPFVLHDAWMSRGWDMGWWY